MTPQQNWNPQDYQHNAAFVARLVDAVLALLKPEPGERMLDLGCGDGVVTVALKAMGVDILGVDASPEMIEGAKAKGVAAMVMNGEELGFKNEFDAVFSNAALHWMKNHDAVIDGVWNALKPGGRFVAECGGKGNVGAIEAALEKALEKRGFDPAALNPWYFPAPEEYKARLEKQGFRVGEIALHTRPTTLPGNISGWLETFAQPFLKAVPSAERTALIDEVREGLRPVLFKDNVWTADYVRLRFAAEKPA